MGWFRSSRGRAAGLALFALACQLVVTFGHIHLGSFSGGPASWANSIHAGETSPANPQPSQKHPNSLPGNFCAICVNIALAGALIVPDSPVVSAPILFIQQLPWPVEASEPAALEHLTFNARAPPRL
jgi:hypothetical protein